jgi:hypothetical protein
MYSVPKIKKEISFYRYLYGNKSCHSLALADQLSCWSCEKMFVLRNNLLCRKSEGLVVDILLLFRVTQQYDCDSDASDLCYGRAPIFLKPEFGAPDNI